MNALEKPILYRKNEGDRGIFLFYFAQEHRLSIYLKLSFNKCQFEIPEILYIAIYYIGKL